MHASSMIINGEPVRAAQTFDVLNPATEEVAGQCQDGDAAVVDQAVQASRAAFPAWSATPDDERKAQLRRLADAVKAAMPELMNLLTLEVGKPLGGMNGVGSGMEVGGAIAWMRYTTELDLPVDLIQDNEQARVEVHRKPLGVVASITPWNWPLMIAVWHIIPALRTGNTVVIKPSEYAPLATSRMVELANEILPPGVLNLVTGGPAAGAALTEHPGVSKIVFTGSAATGRKIMAAAAGTVKRLTLELGGNDAGIVLPDVDVKQVAPKLLGCAFNNNGQTCAALKRLYVHESIHDELCEELARLAKKLRVGNGLEESTDLGPVQNGKQLAIVENLAEDARAAGGQFLTGGSRMEGPGYFFEPTIVAGLSDGSRLVDEEPFGPIVPVIRYSDIDDAIARANANSNGLGGSVWSADEGRATELAARLECGTAWVNDHCAIQPDAPFGGVKQSGIGVEFGLYGLEEFTSLQTLKVAK